MTNQQQYPSPQDTTKEQEMCEKAWEGTLEHFGIKRPIFSFEKMKIARLIKIYDYKSVVYALTGMRFEQKTQTFDPAKHVGLSRADDPRLFEKFLNLAAQQKTKQDRAS